MPKYACAHCRDPFALTQKENKLIHNNMEVFCSPDCLMNLIEERGYQPGFAHVPKPSFMTRPQNANGTRSLNEAAVIIWIEQRNITALYEPFAIRLQKGDRYVPDLFLPEYNVILEIKGAWWNGSKGRAKVTRVRNELGQERFYLIPDYLCRMVMG